MTTITPTVGRIVWYRTSKGAIEQAAIVTAVSKDGFVDLFVFGSTEASPRNHTLLIQDGQEPPTNHGYAEWMPYQKGQAAKTEALEAKLKV